MGLRQPENTKRASKSGFRLFTQFVPPLIRSGNEQIPYSQLADFLTIVNENNSPEVDETERSSMKVLIHGNTESCKLNKTCKLRLRHFLLEFCACYQSLKKSGPVNPSTMLRYMRGIQRPL